MRSRGDTVRPYSYRENVRGALNNLRGYQLHVFEWDSSAHGVQVSSQLIALVRCRGLHMHTEMHELANETTFFTSVDRVN